MALKRNPPKLFIARKDVIQKAAKNARLKEYIIVSACLTREPEAIFTLSQYSKMVPKPVKKSARLTKNKATKTPLVCSGLTPKRMIKKEAALKRVAAPISVKISLIFIHFLCLALVLYYLFEMPKSSIKTGQKASFYAHFVHISETLKFANFPNVCL
jgi:hypothetical protein